jgi:hypothetical protein
MKATAEMRLMRAKGMSYAAIAAHAGVAKSTVQEAFGARKRGERVADAKPKTDALAGRTLSDFRKEHDQTWKIRDGLKRLFGGQVIMTDAEFREAVNGNPSRWRAAADQTEFKEHRYRVGGELLWASRETIREMRKIRGEAL